MNLDFTIPVNWDELNDYQYKKISGLISIKTADISSLKNKLLFYLFIPKLNLKHYLKFRRLLWNVPVSELYSYTDFLFQMLDRTRFPDFIFVKGKRFYGPAARLANLTIEEYSAADLFFYNWKTQNSLIDLDRLVAVLYREKSDIDIPGDIRRPYHELELYNRGAVVPLLDLDTKLAIGIAFMSCRSMIVKKYPAVFPIKKRAEPVVFPKLYNSFSLVMSSMAMGEIQPLGDYSKVKKTLINPFFSILNESIVQQKKREELYRKNNLKK